MEHNCDAEKSSVKQFLVSSYDRVLSPKVRASVTAAVSAAAASEDAATIGNQLKNSLPRHIYIYYNIQTTLPKRTRNSCQNRIQTS